MESLGVQLSSKALKAIIAEVVLEIFTTMYEMWFFAKSERIWAIFPSNLPVLM